MLIVNKLYGQMGNQILHYNNLVQLSHIFEQDSLSLSFTNNHLFNLNNLSKNTNQIKMIRVYMNYSLNTIKNQHLKFLN